MNTDDVPSTMHEGEAVPRRGDTVEEWIKRHRETHRDSDGALTGAWYALDGLLDDYQLHADTGTPLDREVGEPGGEFEPERWEVPAAPTGVRAVRNGRGLWVLIRDTGSIDHGNWRNRDFPLARPSWAHLLADGPLVDATHELAGGER